MIFLVGVHGIRYLTKVIEVTYWSEGTSYLIIAKSFGIGVRNIRFPGWVELAYGIQL